MSNNDSNEKDPRKTNGSSDKDVNDVLEERKKRAFNPLLGVYMDDEPEDGEDDSIPTLEEEEDDMIPGLTDEPDVTEEDDDVIPGLEDDTEDVIPGLDDEESDLEMPTLEEEDDTIPGLSDDVEDDDMIPGLSDDVEDDDMIPGLSDDTEVDDTIPGLSDETEEDDMIPGLSDETEEDDMIPGLSDDTEDDDMIPGLSDDTEVEEVDDTIPGLSDDAEDDMIPGLSDDTEVEEVDDTIPGLSDDAEDDMIPGISDDTEVEEVDDTIPGLSDDADDDMIPGLSDDTEVEEVDDTIPGLSDDADDDMIPGLSNDTEVEEVDDTIPGLSDDAEEDDMIPGLSNDTEEDDMIPGLSDDTEVDETDDDMIPGLSNDTEEDDMIPGLSDDTEVDETDDDMIPGLSNDTEEDDMIPGLSDDTEVDETEDDIVPGLSNDTEDDDMIPGLSNDTEEDDMIPGLSDDTEVDETEDDMIPGLSDDTEVDEVEETEDDMIPGLSNDVEEDEVVPEDEEDTVEVDEVEETEDDMIPGLSDDTETDEVVPEDEKDTVEVEEVEDTEDEEIPDFEEDTIDEATEEDIKEVEADEKARNAVTMEDDDIELESDEEASGDEVDDMLDEVETPSDEEVEADDEEEEYNPLAEDSDEESDDDTPDYYEYYGLNEEEEEEEEEEDDDEEEEKEQIYPEKLIDFELECIYLGLLFNNPKAMSRFYLLYEDCRFSDDELTNLYKIVLFRDGEQYAPAKAKDKYQLPRETPNTYDLKLKVRKIANSKDYNLENIYTELKKLFILKKNYVVAATSAIQEKILEITDYELYDDMTVEEVESALEQITVTTGLTQGRLNENATEFLLAGDNELANGLSIPFPILSTVFKGIRRGETMCYAMPSNCGKSRFTINLASYLSFIHKEKVLIISNEMAEDKMKLCMITTIVNNPEIQKLHGQEGLSVTESELLELQFRPDKGKKVKVDENGYIERKKDESQEDYVARLEKYSSTFKQVLKVTDWVNTQVDNSIFFIHITEHTNDDLRKIIMNYYYKEGIHYMFYDTLKADTANIGNSDEVKKTATILSNLAQKFRIFIASSMQLIESNTLPVNLTVNEMSASKTVKEVLDTLMLIKQINRSTAKDYEYSDTDLFEKNHDIVVPKDTDVRFYACVVDKNRAGAKPTVLFRLNLAYNRWEELGHVKLKAIDVGDLIERG